jgi:hypothetical protein
MMLHALTGGTTSLVLIAVLASVLNAQNGSSSATDSEQNVPAAGSASAAAKAPCLDQAARTPAQRKISSQLLCVLYPPKPPFRGRPRLRTDGEGRVLVDIRARVTEKLIAGVGKLGGKVVSHSERYNSILAYVALDKLEEIAELPQVKAIRPAAEAITN